MQTSTTRPRVWEGGRGAHIRRNPTASLICIPEADLNGVCRSAVVVMVVSERVEMMMPSFVTCS